MTTHKFLSERPLQGEQQFGHNEITETLATIVDTCNERFTIGLFGKWGSGKSSIAYSLQKRLLPKEIPVIIFDVWKHEGNSLKRTFLEEIVRALQSTPYGKNFFPQDFHLGHRVKSNIQSKSFKSFDINFQVIWPFLWKAGALVLGGYILFYLITYGLEKLGFSTYSIENNVKNTINVTVILSIGLSILSGLKDMIQKNEETIVESRLEDSHEFESEFISVLRKLKPNRIVVVFDNLDRLQGEAMLQVLSAVKTFLDPKSEIGKRVIFIVPCDVEAIKKQIGQKSLGESISEREGIADEFLRKIFNTILWIPDFYAVELETFAVSKLQETKIKEFDNQLLAWLIIQVFRQNPRQIIQFINILISNYLLFKLKSQEGAFGDKDFYRQNIPQLAKYLLLLQRFPAEMNEYRRTRTYDFNIELYPSGDTSSTSEFIAFRADTSDIYIKSLEPFFNLKISEEEQLLPGILGLFQLLDEGQIESAVDYYRKIHADKNHKAFCKAIESALYTRPTSRLTNSFINGILILSSQLNLNFLPETYRMIHKKLAYDPLSGFEVISPIHLENQYYRKLPLQVIGLNSTKRKVTERWLTIIDEQSKSGGQHLNPEREREIMLGLISNFQLLSPNSTDRIFNLLANDKYILDLQICRAIFTSINVEQLLSGPAILRMISTMRFQTQDEVKHSFEILELLEMGKFTAWNTVQISAVVDKLRELLSVENQSKSLRPDCEPVFEGICRVIELFSFMLVQVDINILNSFLSELRLSFDRSKWQTTYYVMPLVLRVGDLKIEQVNETTRHMIREFFSYVINLDLSTIKYVLDKVKDSSRIVANPAYSPILEQHALTNRKFFSLLFKYAGTSQRAALLQHTGRRLKVEWVRDVLEDIRTDVNPETLVGVLKDLKSVVEGTEHRKAIDELIISSKSKS